MAPSDWRGKCACFAHTSHAALPSLHVTSYTQEVKFLLQFPWTVGRLYLIFLYTCINNKAHVIMHIKAEERARLSTSFVDDEIIERVMLEYERERESNHHTYPLPSPHLWDDEVLLHIHQVVHITNSVK